MLVLKQVKSFEMETDWIYKFRVTWFQRFFSHIPKDVKEGEILIHIFGIYFYFLQSHQCLFYVSYVLCLFIERIIAMILEQKRGYPNVKHVVSVCLLCADFI